jgi:hypothetical protein
MARRLRRRLAMADFPPVFCDAQRALWGPKPGGMPRCAHCAGDACLVRLSDFFTELPPQIRLRAQRGLQF